MYALAFNIIQGFINPGGVLVTSTTFYLRWLSIYPFFIKASFTQIILILPG